MLVNNGLSIIIPTYQEARNITLLIEKIAKIDFNNRPFEVLIVDDNSNDGIVNIVSDLREQYPWLRIIVRDAKRDLSQSIIDGFNDANYPILITLDADLSHPPEKILELLAALSEPDVEIALGSRYVKGGSMDDMWPLSRKIASRLSALVARLLLGIKLTDPLSGFFAIRKDTLNSGDTIKTIGWKWGLEIMIKCHCKNIREIPIHFAQRKHGVSKLNFVIAFNYFRHIQSLFLYKLLSRI